jgi:hypothetical protein
VMNGIVAVVTGSVIGTIQYFMIESP